MIKFSDVSKRYKSKMAIKSVNLNIEDGNLYLFIGDNGSGKSTLIALILGDHQQGYANNLTLFGRARGTGESIWDIKKKLGWVSPELHTCIDEQLSIFNVVLSGFSDTPYPSGRFTKAKKDAALALLDKLGIERDPTETFGSLSGGEQRLVLLARALVKQPPLLVLDEPCQNLDKKNRERFLKLLDALCADSATALVFVTHLRGTMPKCIKHKLLLTRG